MSSLQSITLLVNRIDAQHETMDILVKQLKSDIQQYIIELERIHEEASKMQ